MKIQENIQLKDFSNFKIGGPSKFFAQASNEEELKEILNEWKSLSENFSDEERRIFVFGDGTNILFSDNGFKGLSIKVSIKGIEKKDNLIRVGAGERMSDLLTFTIENGLSGLEWAGGLPGTVGGAVRGNAGAYNGETKDNIFNVESLDLSSLEIKTRSKKDCRFDYRNSIFKKELEGKELITRVSFQLSQGDKNEIKTLIEDKINKRKLRHPLEYPNLGSIFKNVPLSQFSSGMQEELLQYVKNDPFPVIPTAKTNFLAGLSGQRVGDAQLSTKHTNFIVNLGNATSNDVESLIKIIKEKVNQKFSVILEEEISYLN